jgi:hypothetical protein
LPFKQFSLPESKLDSLLYNYWIRAFIRWRWNRLNINGNTNQNTSIFDLDNVPYLSLVDYLLTNWWNWLLNFWYLQSDIEKQLP